MSQQAQDFDDTKATGTPPKLVSEFADAHGLPPGVFMKMLEQATGEAATTRNEYYKLLEVSKKYALDPLVKQVYLIKTKKGYEVVIPIDGWLHIMHRHPEYLAHEIVENWETVVDPKDPKNTRRDLISATCKLWTRKRENMKLGPYEWTEYMAECYIAPRNGYSGPWQSHPARMLKHKAASQAVRYELGVYIPTEDEFRRAGMLLDEVIQRTEIEREIGSTVPPEQRADPSIPIRGLRRPELPPAPPDLDEPGKPEATAGTPLAAEGGAPRSQPEASSGTDAGPTASPAPSAAEFDAAESARLDAELAGAKPKDGLFA